MLNLSFNFLKNIKNFIFPFYRNKDLKFIFKKLQESSPGGKVAARFVGGCVRKHLSNEKIDDIDIATILTTDQIKEKFKDTNLKVIDTGIKHGTVTIVSKNHKVELTTLRKDIKTDGRHAEVEYTDSWQQDSERRDFTINAIYMDINGKLYDPQMGTVDLKNKNIKFIGDPQKRIEEDYLRIVRFIRFKVMYDIVVEPTTTLCVKVLPLLLLVLTSDSNSAFSIPAQFHTQLPNQLVMSKLSETSGKLLSTTLFHIILNASALPPLISPTSIVASSLTTFAGSYLVSVHVSEAGDSLI